MLVWKQHHLGWSGGGLEWCMVWMCLFHLATSTSPTPPSTPGIDTDGMIRLPQTLRPTHYELRLQAFMSGNFSVLGQVKVEVTALVNTRYVIMHMADIITLNHTAKMVDLESGEEYRILDQTYNPLRTLYVVTLEEELHEGHNYSFTVNYLGSLGQHPRGFYRSSYVREDGQISWVAATQFQATDARRAFPCFDEPHLKATFKVFLARQQGITALSNMPLMASVPVPGTEGWVWDEFQKSVAMSTYVVAFGITDYPVKVISGQDGRSTLIRVWARSAVNDQLEYGSWVMSEGLRVFENIFGVPFPLPKTDLFCPPEMSPNAMENWGLITFRESGLLYNPNLSSANRKLWVCYLVAHELAHMWFGNLVTLSWWTDLWLNEGFATYLADVAVDQIEPTWGKLDMFVVSRVQAVMAQDALRSSHPVSRPVHDPSTINQIFDAISYLKGASIIRMMNHFLTEATFRRGLTDYLTTLQYGSAEQDDLWRFLTTAGHRDGTLPPHLTVKTIMDTWTLQMGFPVVTVTRNGNHSALVTQEYFSLDERSSSSSSSSSNSISSLSDSSTNSQSSSSSLPSSSTLPSSSHASSSSSPVWWIPLTYTSQDQPDFSDTRVKRWLSGEDNTKQQQEEEIEYPSPGHWAVFNVKQTGYYRVNYDEENWSLLTQQLQEDHTAIHVTNRAQMIDDAFNLARAGRLSYGVVLELIGYLEKEREYVAWQAVLNNLQHLYYMMNRDPAYGALKDYLLSLLLPVYRSLGGLRQVLGDEDQAAEGEAAEEEAPLTDNDEEDSLPAQLLKGEVVWWVCRLNHPECVAPALTLYRSWMDNPNEMGSVSASVRDAVSCTAVREGGEEEWVFAWRMRDGLKSALGCTKEIWLLNRYLDGAFNSSSGIRRQDAALTFRDVAREPLGVLVAWDYLTAHWTKVSQYIGTTFFALPGMIIDVTRSFNTPQQLQEVEDFEREHSPDGGLVTAGLAVTQVIEAIRTNMAWVAHHRGDILHLLATKGFSSDLANL